MSIYKGSFFSLCEGQMIQGPVLVRSPVVGHRCCRFPEQTHHWSVLTHTCPALILDSGSGSSLVLLLWNPDLTLLPPAVSCSHSTLLPLLTYLCD